jgi:hypothetical protein
LKSFSKGFQLVTHLEKSIMANANALAVGGDVGAIPLAVGAIPLAVGAIPLAVGAEVGAEAKSKIFRYKLSDEIMSSITQFAKIHQLDDRHMYKEAWNRWLVNEQDNVEREVARLEQLDYKGDILDKMFKAGRYYFREKVAIKAKPANADTDTVNTANTNADTDTDTNADTNKKTREYIVMDPVIIQTMDQHLRGLMSNKNFKPALAYNQFCEQHTELVRQEIRRLMAQNIPSEKMSAKIKKTYKNRYYILHNAA